MLGSARDPSRDLKPLSYFSVQPLWEEVRAATAELVAESGHDLLAAIAAVEERLSARSMDDRLRARIVKKPDLSKETLS